MLHKDVWAKVFWIALFGRMGWFGEVRLWVCFLRRCVHLRFVWRCFARRLGGVGGLKRFCDGDLYGRFGKFGGGRERIAATGTPSQYQQKKAVEQQALGSGKSGGKKQWVCFFGLPHRAFHSFHLIGDALLFGRSLFLLKAYRLFLDRVAWVAFSLDVCEGVFVMEKQKNKMRWLYRGFFCSFFAGLWLAFLACGDVPVLQPTKFFCNNTTACDTDYVCQGNVCVLAGQNEGNSHTEGTSEPSAEIPTEAGEPSGSEETVSPDSTEPNPQEASIEESEPIEPITDSTIEPTVEPTAEPTAEPTNEPTAEPPPDSVAEPTAELIGEPVSDGSSPEPSQEVGPDTCVGPSGQKCCQKADDCTSLGPGAYCALNGSCYAKDKCTNSDPKTCPTLGDVCKKDGKCGDCANDGECGSGGKCSLQKRCFYDPCTSSADCPTGMDCQQSRTTSRCVAPLKRDALNNVVGWGDGAVAKDCMEYRYPPAGYEAATKDGVYQILDKADQHWVSCNMTYAGGGWTLTMKIKKTGSTFEYDSPKWEDDKLVSATPQSDDALLDGSDAKLRSYTKVGVKQIMLQMQTEPDVATPVAPTERRRAILTLDQSKPSLMEVMKAPTPALSVGGGLERQNWRALINGSEVYSYPCAEGLKKTKGANLKIRMGLISSDAAACTTNFSVLGVGVKYDSAANGSFGAGFWRGGTRSIVENVYAYLWVRAFPTPSQQLVTVNNALAYGSNQFAKSCLDYRMPPAVSEISGEYWLAGSSGSYRTYCDMTKHGGGWTLALKINGKESTFAFDNATAWANGVPSSNVNQSHAPLSQGSFSLASYTSLAPQQIMLEQTVLDMSSGTKDSTLTSLVVHLDNPNSEPLSKVFVSPNPAALRFAYPLGAMAWMEWFPNPMAKLHKNCVLEGFSKEQSWTTDIFKHAKVRIGAVGQEEDCGVQTKQTLSWIGLGGTGTACNLNSSWIAGASSGDCGVFASKKLDIVSQMNLYLR